MDVLFLRTGNNGAAELLANNGFLLILRHRLAWLTSTTSSRRSTIQALPPAKFVNDTAVREDEAERHASNPSHALILPKVRCEVGTEYMYTLRSELAWSNSEGTSVPSYTAMPEIRSLEYFGYVNPKWFCCRFCRKKPSAFVAGRPVTRDEGRRILKRRNHDSLF